MEGQEEEKLCCLRPSLNLSICFRHNAQRLKHVISTGYSLFRPVAYYGMIPFVLYVGMNGDAAPSWVDLPRYLIAVL